MGAMPWVRTPTSQRSIAPMGRSYGCPSPLHRLQFCGYVAGFVSVASAHTGRHR